VETSVTGVGECEFVSVMGIAICRVAVSVADKQSVWQGMFGVFDCMWTVW